MTILWFGISGALGSVIRYLSTKLQQKLVNYWNFPLITLLINVIGAFLLGLNYNLLVDHTFLLTFFTGLLSGFTTFSTYLNESVQLNKYSSLIYLLSTAIFGLLGAEIGLIL